MLKRLAEHFQPFLESPYILRTRRNHGLEHATIHILARKVRGLRMAGRSSDTGFWLFGEAPTEAVEEAAYEALRRMQSGEHQLALHPNCGTNLVTTGVLTGLVALVGFAGVGRRKAFDRLPTVVSLMMFAVLFSQPLGMSFQRYFTTAGDPGDMEIVSIKRTQIRLPWQARPMVVHRVNTWSS
ncbi:MAG: hypothetical protein D6737_00745 [Chloroflexi bacterium]|nr:MAG: hypothetical protein D6737_00745 [Chloroflexota bacterium]